MPANSRYFPLKIELDYEYSLGDLKPYFDALCEGRALASHCEQCGRVHFPPRLICEDDRRETTWHELSGLGTIMQVTVGRNSGLALISMDGADNCCLGRLDSANLKKNDRVKLESIDCSGTEHPAQCAFFRKIS